MEITREQVINYINSFASIVSRVDIIRSYCIESGKDEVETEMFLQGCRNKTVEMATLAHVTRQQPIDIITELARYILNKKVVELGIYFLRDSDKPDARILKIY